MALSSAKKLALSDIVGVKPNRVFSPSIGVSLSLIITKSAIAPENDKLKTKAAKNGANLANRDQAALR
jgi:hypothetical protein